MIKRFGILLVIFLIFLSASVSADILTTNAGEEYKGNLLTISGGVLKFKLYGKGEVKEFPVADVMRIELSKTRSGDTFSKVEKLKDPILNEAIKIEVSQKDYPNSSYVTLYKEYIYKLNPDNSSEVEIRLIRKSLNEDGRSIATQSFTFLGDNEDMEILWARAIKKDGSLFHVEENAIAKTSVFSTNPDYERLKSLKLTVPEVKVGDISDIKVKKTRKVNDIFRPFYVESLFRESEPVFKKVVKVYIPENMKYLPPVEKRLDKGDVQFKESKEKGYKVLTWISKNSKEVIRENMMPSYHLIFPKIAVTMEGQWEDIKSEYQTALKDSLDTNEDFKTRLNSLVKDSKSDFEILNKLYDYVAKKIKFIYVSPGSYSYKPKKISEIHKKSSGNSLDKSFFLYALLKEAGLNPEFLLVSPSSYGEFYKELPSIEQFSTAIVKVTVDNRNYYLYPVNETLGLYELPKSYQNRIALNVTGKEMFETIPIFDKDIEFSKADYKMILQANGTIIVDKTFTAHGSASGTIRSYKDLMKEEIDKNIQNIVNAADTKAELISYKILNMKELDKPIKIKIKYRIKDYAIVAGKKFFVFKIPEIRYGAYNVGKPTRTFPMKWNGISYYSNNVELTYPKGYKVYYIPKKLEKKVEDSISYTAEFKTKGNKIYFKDEYYRTAEMFPSSVYKSFKAFIEDRAQYSKEWIILER